MAPFDLFLRSTDKLLHGLFGLVSIMLPLCVTADPASEYLASIHAQRLSIDEQFRNPRLSPLSALQLGSFQGLVYFPVQPEMRIKATFERATSGVEFHLPSSSNAILPFTEYGVLRFHDLDGAQITLTLFQRENLGAAGRLTALLPFRDATNGKSTYSGGRYLKFLLPLAEPPVVDFNRAENPYCAYDPSIACPLAPRSNWLTFPVPAGEKAYVGAKTGTAR